MKAFSLVEPGLWVGGSPELYHFPRQIQAVVNLQREATAFPFLPTVQAVMWLPIKDEDFPGLSWLVLAVGAVKSFRDQDWNVLVHCMMGISRAVMVSAAYLIKHRGMTAKEALTLLQRACPQADPSHNFRAGLEDFEKLVRNVKETP